MLIADELVASHSYGTLGNLGLASKAMHQDIVPLLFGTMVLDHCWNMDERWGTAPLLKPESSLSLEKWKHAR
jgi:hypothetical protein